jgi:hypothetical protein
MCKVSGCIGKFEFVDYRRLAWTLERGHDAALCYAHLAADSLRAANEAIGAKIAAAMMGGAKTKLSASSG